MMFLDVSPDRRNRNDIQRVVEYGLMPSYPDGFFRPGQNISREEMASILSRLLFREKLVTQILPQVALASVVIENDGVMGGGAFVTPQGHIITSARLVGGRREIDYSRNDKIKLSAAVLAIHSDFDLALLKAREEPGAFLEILTDNVKREDHIGIVSISENHGYSFTQGQVSNQGVEDTFRSDAPSIPGTICGFVIDEKGRLAGMVATHFLPIDTIDITFCVHAGLIRKIVERNSTPQ